MTEEEEYLYIMNGPDRLLRLAHDDFRGAFFCFTQSLRKIWEHFAFQDRRPVVALDLAESWACGAVVSPAELRKVSTESFDASSDYLRDGFQPQTNMARIAGTAAFAPTLQPPNPTDRLTFAVADVHATLLLFAESPAGKHLGVPDGYEYEALLRDVIDDQLTPVSPTTGGHPVWDRVVEICPQPRRIGTLGAALKRAYDWGLPWEGWGRGVAERFEALPAPFQNGLEGAQGDVGKGGCVSTCPPPLSTPEPD